MLTRCLQESISSYSNLRVDLRMRRLTNQFPTYQIRVPKRGSARDTRNSTATLSAIVPAPAPTMRYGPATTADPNPAPVALAPFKRPLTPRRRRFLTSGAVDCIERSPGVSRRRHTVPSFPLSASPHRPNPLSSRRRPPVPRAARHPQCNPLCSSCCLMMRKMIKPTKSCVRR